MFTEGRARIFIRVWHTLHRHSHAIANRASAPSSSSHHTTTHPTSSIHAKVRPLSVFDYCFESHIESFDPLNSHSPIHLKGEDDSCMHCLTCDRGSLRFIFSVYYFQVDLWELVEISRYSGAEVLSSLFLRLCGFDFSEGLVLLASCCQELQCW